jgi:hypothetical protein
MALDIRRQDLTVGTELDKNNDWIKLPFLEQLFKFCNVFKIYKETNKKYRGGETFLRVKVSSL